MSLRTHEGWLKGASQTREAGGGQAHAEMINDKQARSRYVGSQVIALRSPSPRRQILMFTVDAEYWLYIHSLS